MCGGAQVHTCCGAHEGQRTVFDSWFKLICNHVGPRIKLRSSHFAKGGFVTDTSFPLLPQIIVFVFILVF